MKLFLTGSEGFIGKNLVRACKDRGIEVGGVDAATPALSGFTQADICDPAIADIIPEQATIVHLAAVSRDSDCRADPRRAFDINVAGTLNLAAAGRRRRVAQFIFASTEWVYGDVRNDEIQTEDQAIDLTRMQSEYAISKLTAEQLLRLDKTLTNTTILRFGIVYGPRDGNWSAVESLCSKVCRGEEITVGSSRTARRFIHVDDIVSGIFSCVGQPGFAIYNLSGDQLINLGLVVETAAALMDKNVSVQESNPENISIRNPDNSKAKANLNWTPRIGLKSGLSSLISHFTAAQGTASCSQ